MYSSCVIAELALVHQHIRSLVISALYCGTSDKGPFWKGKKGHCSRPSISTFLTSKKETASLQETKKLIPKCPLPKSVSLLLNSAAS